MLIYLILTYSTLKSADFFLPLLTLSSPITQLLLLANFLLNLSLLKWKQPNESWCLALKSIKNCFVYFRYT